MITNNEVNNPFFKRGFTLIEVTVVAAIFGIMALIAANYLISTFSVSNRIAVENEVRQNVTQVMQDIEDQVRKAACVYFEVNVGDHKLLRMSDSLSDTTCEEGKYVEFKFNNDGSVQRITGDNGVVSPASNISSDSVAFVDCDGENVCQSEDVSECAIGITAVPTSDEGSWPTREAVEVTLTARQAHRTNRVDSCADFEISETVTPRNF